MNIESKRTGNETILSITASKQDLEPIVRSTYNRLRESVEAKGFRPGKAPNDIIDRELGEQTVHAEIIDAAAQKFYRQAVESEDVRPINSPHVEVKKFVPHNELELEIKVEVMPEVKLGDYKKISQDKPAVEVTDDEVDNVLTSLQDRFAEREEVDRAAKEGDEVTIDFIGTRNGKPVDGAEAKDYPLQLGSNRFIPGFEEELIGLKAGDDKVFTIKFPDDYNEQSLAGTEVEFNVSVKKVSETKRPKLDDEFAGNAGPFKNLEHLKTDIHDHLKSEKEQQQERAFNNEVVDKVVDQAKVDLPQSMVDAERQRVESDFLRSLSEQGLDKDEYLKKTGQTEDKHQKEIDEQAERRVKTSLVLTEVATQEGLEVTPDELEVRAQVLAGQYQDEKIREELTKPEVRREIANQMLAEKTVEKLGGYATEDGGNKSEKTDKKSTKKPTKKSSDDKSKQSKKKTDSK